LCSIFDDLFMLFPTLFRPWILHRCYIDVDKVLVSFLMVSCWIFRSRTHLAKPPNSITLTMNLHDFTFQKNMDFHDVPHRFR
jgi:hypothetical protein